MRKKKWLVAVVILAAGAFLWHRSAPPGWGGRARSAPKTESAVSSRAAKADRGEVSLTFKETGVVATRVSVDVRSKVSGKVKRLMVEEGDAVKEGQSLAVIEPDVQEALRLVERRTRVAELRANLEQRKQDMERLRALHRDGFVSQQEMDRAEVELRNAEQSFELDRVSLDAIERDYGMTSGGAPDGRLADYLVTAPLSGVATKVLVKEGELATSGVSGVSREGSHLLTIADVSDMVVLSQLSEVDVSKIREGARVRVNFPAQAGLSLRGEVERVSLAGSRDDRNLVRFPLTVRLDDPKHPALRPGISCNVDIEVFRKENVLRIPLLAFGEEDGKTYVKRKVAPSSGGKAGAAEAAFERHEVTVGVRGGAHVEVLDGLSEGDEIAANYGGGHLPEGFQTGSQWRRMR